MVGGKLHNEGSRIACEHLRLLQDDTGDDDRHHAYKVRGGRNPCRAAEQSRRDHRDDREFRSAGDKCRCDDRHTTVSFVFNGSRCHDAGHAATGSDQHRNEGFTGQAEATEDTVHDESDTRHVSASLQKRQAQEQHEHLRQEAEDRADAGHDTVEDQALQPVRAVDRVQPLLDQGRDAWDPDTIIGRIRCGKFALFVQCFPERGVDVVNLAALLFELVILVMEGAVRLFKRAEIGILKGFLKFAGALDIFIFRCRVDHRLHRIREHEFSGPGVDFVIVVAAHAEQVEAIAERAVIDPVRTHGADRGNGEVVYQEHDQAEYGQCEETVGHNAVDLIGRRVLTLAVLFVAGLDDLADMYITLVRDDGLCVVVHLALGVLNVFFNVLADLFGEAEFLDDLLVALEQFDRVPALLVVRDVVDRRLFDVGDRMLGRSAKDVQRNRCLFAGRLDRDVGRILNTGTLLRRNGHYGASQSLRELLQVDAVIVLLNDIHHIDGDNDRKSQLQ